MRRIRRQESKADRGSWDWWTDLNNGFVDERRHASECV
jgi:hypothetical protein